MEAAINLAGTGHLVLATLHANNCAETLDRIINMFPHDQHNQVLPRSVAVPARDHRAAAGAGVDGKRVAAVELMLNTPHISELVRKGDVSTIKEAIRNSAEKGIQSFDNSLVGLYKAGRVSMDDALANADSRTNLEGEDQFRLSRRS
jgi:twitching motility protein PilU